MRTINETNKNKGVRVQATVDPAQLDLQTNSQRSAIRTQRRAADDGRHSPWLRRYRINHFLLACARGPNVPQHRRVAYFPTRQMRSHMGLRLAGLAPPVDFQSNAILTQPPTVLPPESVSELRVALPVTNCVSYFLNF